MYYLLNTKTNTITRHKSIEDIIANKLIISIETEVVKAKMATDGHIGTEVTSKVSIHEMGGKGVVELKHTYDKSFIPQEIKADVIRNYLRDNIKTLGYKILKEW